MIAADRPTIPVARYGDRLGCAQAGMPARDAAALLIGTGADLLYLTGYNATVTERLTLLAIPASGRPFLVAPRLEAMKAAACPAAATGRLDIIAWDETDDAHAVVAAKLAEASNPAPGSRADREGRVLVSSGLWAMHVLGLQRVLPGAAFGLATEVLRDLRMAKDTKEIGLLRLAAEAADRAMTAIAAGALVGRTEAEVSREIRERLIAEGHDDAGFAIVASGPNSASPHHESGERRIQAGEPVVFDIGGHLGGYASDTTRTVWIAGPDGEQTPTADFVEVQALVREANERATAAVHPGVTCEGIDAFARRTIAAAGYGEAFLHRVGHGIGLEGHEEPYLVAGNGEALREGVAFSIEPGIYLDGRFGVRIEDIVICGADGPVVLNRTPRDLWVVAG